MQLEVGAGPGPKAQPIEFFISRIWSLWQPKCAYGKNQKIMQHMHGNIPHVFVGPIWLSISFY